MPDAAAAYGANPVALAALALAGGILAATMSTAVKAATARQEYIVRAVSIGVDQETAERVLAEVLDDRSHRGLSLEPAPRIAFDKLCDTGRTKVSHV